MFVCLIAFVFLIRSVHQRRACSLQNMCFADSMICKSIIILSVPEPIFSNRSKNHVEIDLCWSRTDNRIISKLSTTGVRVGSNIWFAFAVVYMRFLVKRSNLKLTSQLGNDPFLSE